MRVALLVVLVSSTAFAAPKTGKYKRVGGWSYMELKGTRSCGKEPREFVQKAAERMRELAIEKERIRWDDAGDGVPIVSRDADSILAAAMSDDKVNGTPVTRAFTFGVTDEFVVFSRTILSKGEEVCGDAVMASIERRKGD